MATGGFLRWKEGGKVTEAVTEARAAGFTGSHSSSSRWALMPPKPKALTAARRRPPRLLSLPGSPLTQDAERTVVEVDPLGRIGKIGRWRQRRASWPEAS